MNFGHTYRTIWDILILKPELLIKLDILCFIWQLYMLFTVKMDFYKIINIKGGSSLD